MTYWLQQLSLILLLLGVFQVVIGDDFVYPGALHIPQKNMATSTNPDFNDTEVIYHSEDTVEKVADWLSTQLKQKGVAIKNKILFILPLEPEIKNKRLRQSTL